MAQTPRKRRKLSPAGPMVLHAKVCGSPSTSLRINSGRRRIKSKAINRDVGSLSFVVYIFSRLALLTIKRGVRWLRRLFWIAPLNTLTMSWSAVVAIPVSWILPQQTVAILYSVQAIIDNGGFQYLFENDFPFNPPYSKFVEAYRRIGSHQVAERLANAVAMFPFENPHLKQAERLKFMETLEEENEFFALGDEVCGDKQVWTALQEYAKKNAMSFPIAVN